MHSTAPWAVLFFGGRRLEAEVSLHAEYLRNPGSVDLELESYWFLRAAGLAVDPQPPMSLRPLDQVGWVTNPYLSASITAYQAAANDPLALRQLAVNEPLYPDPLLLWATRDRLPRATHRDQRRSLLQRVGLLLSIRFPQRLDLLLALVASEGAMDVLKSLPDAPVLASQFYTHTQASMLYLQSLWVKGRYAELLLAYSHYQLHHRWFPGSDYMLRSYTVIGAMDRVDALFRSIYRRHHAELMPTSLSNMLFTALGMESIDQPYIAQLVTDWRLLSRETSLPRPPSDPQSKTICRPFTVRERPTLVVMSADLRMHPVGRFWLPIVPHLRQQFNLVHLAFHPLDHDSIRTQLQQHSDSWHLLDSSDTPAIEALLREYTPDLLLDLGGHTADNRPGLLNQRFASVQASYLGFYGPTYAEHCDWWVLDPAIARRVKHSYPGSEPIWELPCPSLCYDTSTHGLQDLSNIRYCDTDHPVIGSFNHTRKLTAACISRFGAILKAMPDAVLQFRSHSFFDPHVRARFLRQFLDAGISPHQLQPLAYAPSGVEALQDYGRLHLHLDSYPVSGTTTTLDALAMGIPVLTCPNHLYAGAISAAILEHAGFSEMICERPEELPQQAERLCRLYSTTEARRSLAESVRQSPICDTSRMPRLFTQSLAQMLRVASL